MRYRFNCSNIGRIALRQQIGHGVTKRVYLGHSVDDEDAHRPVAVKMVTRKSMDVSKCLRRQQTVKVQDATDGERQRCFIAANMKLMKEILLLNQLKHHAFVPLLGYCVRSEETDSTSLQDHEELQETASVASVLQKCCRTMHRLCCWIHGILQENSLCCKKALQDHGVVAVYEYGTHFYATSMKDWPIERRLNTAIQLVDLAVYLQHSPLGSLRVADFKQTHFLLLDGGHRIAMTDLDDVTSAEPSCDAKLRITPDANVLSQSDAVTPTNCPYRLQVSYINNSKRYTYK